jgi:glycosyltransferase involved in cell wall biosynthesis
LYLRKRILAQPHKIFINGKFLCQKATGVQKYALGISLALQKVCPEITVLVPKGKFVPQELNIQQTGFGRGFFWEQLWLPLFLLFKRKTLLVNLCNSAPLFIKAQIVTIHDLAFLKNKKWFSGAFRRWYRFLIPRICRRSRQIITVSDFIKREIRETYAIAENKINVVPNGIPKMEYDDQRPTPVRYLFLTGVFNSRKNSDFVLSQWDEIKKRNYHIIGVGAKAAIYADTRYQQDKKLKWLEYVNDKLYYNFLKHADALIFPSEYEGFGIPVLEAIVMGTPVIVPDLDVYRESFGDLPIYYTAGDTDSFLSALEKINNRKSDKIDSSYLKNKFNFDKSAETLFGIVKQHQFYKET